MSCSRMLRALACALVAASSLAQARLTEIRVTSIEPLAEGHAFGAVGAYERVKGIFKGELDPADARNRVIVNIDKAPRNAAGRIEYEADFYILRPVDPAKASGKLLYDVTNRGRQYAHWMFGDATRVRNDPRTLEDVGNGLLMRRGYTIVYSGWDPDAPRASNGMAMSTIVATEHGESIVRTIRVELMSQGRGPAVKTFRLPYEAATLDIAQARLTVRRNEADPRRPVATSGWGYVNAREIRLLPEGTLPEPGSLYELHYPAKGPKVLGIGMAATRDLVSFLRYETTDAAGNANPARSGIRHVLAFGRSQSGRYLRDHVRDGFNQDESARKVFDGVMAHTAGAGGVFLNFEFGQPARTSTQHEDHLFPENAFPFSTARQTDPVTGQTAGLLRGDGFDPLWIETNTSTEYWQKGASLLVTDPLGTRDVTHPANARGYLVASTQHGAQAWMEGGAGACANPQNPHNPTPALRALLVALDEWVSDGKPPPASRTPSLRDKTFVMPDKTAFPAIPGIVVARRGSEFGVLKDWIKPEMDMNRPYRPLVAQVDADGNETSGIRLPDIAVPLGTHTGWNLYKAPLPAGELCDRNGTFVPFATTRAEREQRGDPRPSLAERYGDHATYVRRYEAAVKQLIGDRLLLAEDGERMLSQARSPEVAARFSR